MLYNNKEMSKFGRVLTTCIYDTVKKGFSQIPVYSNDEYLKEFKKRNKNGGFCELVGLEEYQVKPYFDIDGKGEDFDNNIIDEIVEDINNILLHYTDEEIDIFKSKREPREEEYAGKIKIKHSYRLYVKARISYFNIPIIFKEIFDKYECLVDAGVYNHNRRFFLPLSDNKRGFEVPALNTIIGSYLDNSATYIQEDYFDLDQYIEKPEKEEQKKIKVNEEKEDDNNNEDNDEDETPDKYNRLSNLIKIMKPSRSDCFDTWIKACWAIINISNKENISKRKCFELIHQFSKLSKSEYFENKVDNWIDKNFENAKQHGGYGWTYLLHTVIKEDNPEYYENLNKSYFAMKKEFEKNNAKILFPPMVIHKDRENNIIMQPIHLCEKSHRHLNCVMKETNKKGEEIYKNKKFIELWLDDPKIRRYDKYVFKPNPLKVEEYEYNTWTGFEIAKVPFKNDETIINRFLDYMKNLLNDETVVNYILAYFAARIQSPAQRNMVCIILYGDEGDGKNRLLDIFKNIIGKKYYCELESGKQLFGSHSCIEKEQLFVCVNEAKGKDNYENSEILKARITTNDLVINPKGIQEFKINNFCDYLMTTNNANAVNLHDKSRRYLYVETTSYYSGNVEFFNSFSNDIVDNTNALRVIYEYLLSFDVKRVITSGNFQNHIPETEIQKAIIKDNRDKILYFLEDYANECDYYDKDDLLKVKNNDLFSAWNVWIQKNNVKIEYNNIAFHTRLALLMKKKINVKEVIIKKDSNKNTLINIDLLKNYFIELNK
jgi:hypothetical protein